jgi:hypothetical protein
MDPHQQTDLRDFARKCHLHYEVEREESIEGSRRELVGVRLRLLARHERGKLTVPACPACVELLRELSSFAKRVASDAGVGDRAETIPLTGKLYQSSDDKDADEVALTLRVHCDAPDQRQPGAGEERCWGALRERLAELGVAGQ